MKKLLLLLLLVGFNANGADKPFYSKTGLEGIAKDGAWIVVEDHSKIDKTFDAKAIENQVELRLVQAGIKVGGSGLILYISAQPTIEPFKLIALNIHAKRIMTFEANGKTYRKGATVWDTGGIVGKDNLRAAINIQMDEFLLAYLKANPKKKD